MLVSSLEIKGYKVDIVLPYEYEQCDSRYPVVYVQDGGEMVVHCYNQLDHLSRTGQIQSCIYVGIEPIDRNDDYTPWPKAGLAPGRPAFGGGAKHYLFLVENLIKPYVDQHFRTKTEMESTTMAGASLGALVSLFASYWSGDTFGNYILLSPSMWYEGVMEFLQEEIPPYSRSKQRMFIYVGELEGIYHTTLQQQMVRCCKEAAQVLKEGDFAKFQFVVDPEGTHDSHFFGTYFVEAMKSLFPGSDLLK